MTYSNGYLRINAWVLALNLVLVVPFSFADNDDFIILLDQSKSMLEKQPGDESKGYLKPEQAAKSQEARQAIDDILATLIPGDYIALVLFGNDARVVISQQLLHEHERDVIRNAVGNLKFSDGKTDIVAGISTAGNLISNLGSTERRKFLIMVTDGRNDPDSNSDFFSPANQNLAYMELRHKIHDGRWRVALVGLGAHTDISEVSKNLGLGSGSAVTVIPGDPGSIRKQITGKIREERDAKVVSNAGELTLRPTALMLGGYGAVHTPVTLTSTYLSNVDVVFDSKVRITNIDGLVGVTRSTRINLQPQIPATIDIVWQYSGLRPLDGVLRGRFGFIFADGSTAFYPNAGEVSLILPSWWDTYGVWTIVVLALGVIIAVFVYRYIRKRQVPEIRVYVLSGASAISEPRTLRKGSKLKIGNGDLAGGAVPAPGLSVAEAATITYLGRRRFRADAGDADILSAGTVMKVLEIGLDDSFDLRDSNGKILRTVSLSTSAGLTGDVFGDARSADPF